MNSKGTQRTGKQLVYFTDRETMNECTDDVIKILIPTGKYCAHNLNFVNCFLNNTPPKEQQFILHWGSSHSQYKGFMQDVFEIVTVQLMKDGGEREVHYLIPVPVLLEILGIPVSSLPGMWADEVDRRDPWESPESLAEERMYMYNKIFGRYCNENGVAFHNLQGLVRKRASYMKSMRI